MLYTVIEQSGTCCLSGGVCVASNCTDCAAQSGTFHPGSVGCVLLPCLGHSETEPNNTIATANNADGSFGRFTGDVYHMGISGALSTSTDADYFNIGTLQAGDVLTVSESGLATGIATLDDTFKRLYRAGTSAVVASDDDSGPGTDSLIWRFTIPTTDTYYVRAFKFTAANVGTYRLGILLENSGPAPATGGTFSAEVEPNDTIATANNASNAWRQVQYVSDNAGAIAAADNDFFAYTLHAGDVASVRVFSTSNLDAKVTLRDPAGTIVATEDGTSAGPVADSVIMGYNVPTTGVYTVNVASSGTTTGTYNKILYLLQQHDAAPAVRHRRLQLRWGRGDRRGHLGFLRLPGGRLPGVSVHVQPPTSMAMGMSGQMRISRASSGCWRGELLKRSSLWTAQSPLVVPPPLLRHVCGTKISPRLGLVRSANDRRRVLRAGRDARALRVDRRSSGDVAQPGSGPQRDTCRGRLSAQDVRVGSSGRACLSGNRHPVW